MNLKQDVVKFNLPYIELSLIQIQIKVIPIFSVNKLTFKCILWLFLLFWIYLFGQFVPYLFNLYKQALFKNSILNLFIDFIMNKLWFVVVIFIVLNKIT